MRKTRMLINKRKKFLAVHEFYEQRIDRAAICSKYKISMATLYRWVNATKVPEDA
jgi:hypothetical protein